MPWIFSKMAFSTGKIYIPVVVDGSLAIGTPGHGRVNHVRRSDRRGRLVGQIHRMLEGRFQMGRLELA